MGIRTIYLKVHLNARRGIGSDWRARGYINDTLFRHGIVVRIMSISPVVNCLMADVGRQGKTGRESRCATDRHSVLSTDLDCGTASLVPCKVLHTCLASALCKSGEKMWSIRRVVANLQLARFGLGSNQPL